MSDCLAAVEHAGTVSTMTAGHPSSHLLVETPLVVNTKRVLKVTGSHVHFKSGSVLKTVLEKRP